MQHRQVRDGALDYERNGFGQIHPRGAFEEEGRFVRLRCADRAGALNNLRGLPAQDARRRNRVKRRRGFPRNFQFAGAGAQPGDDNH